MTEVRPKASLVTRLVGILSLPLWAYALIAAVIVVLTGGVTLTGSNSVVSILRRTDHILVFLAAITVVADLCSRAGLFDAIGRFIARASQGRTWILYVGVGLLGLASTTILSLDTTAVLLTPVVLRMARHIRIPPALFALSAVWLANAGSLVLPVSNLTNLLAVDRLATTPLEYLRVMWLPGLVAAAVPVLLLAILHRTTLRRPYRLPEPAVARDALLLRACGAVVLAMVPAIIAGVPVDLIAVAALAVLLAVFLVRDRRAFGWHLLPWRLVILTVALFVAMAGLGKVGADHLASLSLGSSGDMLGLLRTAGVSALAANLFNNLPAYLLLEQALAPGAHGQLFAVLIGVNAGTGILMHGSLATLLWWDRCRKEEVEVSWRSFAAFGSVAVPVTLCASVLALWLMLR